MPWPQTGATHYLVQLRLIDKGREIKWLVVRYVVSRIYDLWDGYLDKRKVCGLVPCCGQDGYQAQLLHKLIDTYKYISHMYQVIELPR